MTDERKERKESMQIIGLTRKDLPRFYELLKEHGIDKDNVTVRSIHNGSDTTN